MEGREIQKLPVPAIKDYNNVFFVASSLSEETGDKFIARTGIDECFIPDEGFQCTEYPDLEEKGWLKNFNFTPETYLRIDGYHYTNGNGEVESMGGKKTRKLAEITKDGIEKFMGLCEKHNAKTVITTDLDSMIGKYYCSENLL